MLTGYTANLPSDVLLGTGVLYVGSTAIGAVRGPQFTPNDEVMQVEVEGNPGAPLKGLDRLFHGEPELSGTLLEFGDSATGNQIAKLLPGAASASAGSPNVTTVTPATGGGFISGGTYLSDVRLIFERGIGSGTKKYAAVYFPYALVSKWGPLAGSAARSEATIPFTIVGRRDPASGSMGDAAYKIELREATP